MSWYYVNKDGFTVGPKTVSELKPLYASKTITESTFVWNGTTVDTWTALKKVSSVYGELRPDKAKKGKSKKKASKSSSKLLKKPSRLSVINKLTKSKSTDYEETSRSNKRKAARSRAKTSRKSRFASLKPLSLTKKDKNINGNNNTKSASTNNKSLKSRKSRGQIQTNKQEQQRQPIQTRESHFYYNQEPIRINHRASNSSSISVSTGSESVVPPKAADGQPRGTANFARPPSLSSINFSVSTAKRSEFLQSQSDGNLLRVDKAPELYSTVSADDIDTMLDEIEDNEKQQQQQKHIFSKIKGKLIKSYTAHTRGSNHRQQQGHYQRGASSSVPTHSKAHCTHCHNHHISANDKIKGLRSGIYRYKICIH